MKHEERLRLERVLRSEEAELAKAEAELRLAQQAFDQFLQEKDRSAVQAQKKYDDSRLTVICNRNHDDSRHRRLTHSTVQFSWFCQQCAYE